LRHHVCPVVFASPCLTCGLCKRVVSHPRFFKMSCHSTNTPNFEKIFTSKNQEKCLIHLFESFRSLIRKTMRLKSMLHKFSHSTILLTGYRHVWTPQQPFSLPYVRESGMEVSTLHNQKTCSSCDEFNNFHHKDLFITLTGIIEEI
jgi:hypothetical protein